MFILSGGWRSRIWDNHVDSQVAEEVKSLVLALHLPSCLGRRMADMAVHLERSVLPPVPIVTGSAL